MACSIAPQNSVRWTTSLIEKLSDLYRLERLLVRSTTGRLHAEWCTKVLTSTDNIEQCQPLIMNGGTEFFTYQQLLNQRYSYRTRQGARNVVYTAKTKTDRFVQLLVLQNCVVAYKLVKLSVDHEKSQRCC